MFEQEYVIINADNAPHHLLKNGIFHSVLDIYIYIRKDRKCSEKKRGKKSDQEKCIRIRNEHRKCHNLYYSSC